MWHTNSSTDQSQNLPSVLKNFNAYDLLEPEKISFASTDVSTAILIDVSDSTDKHSSDINPDLHGSFLEKVKKSEFDLVDLYQNIYVTPQEIKKAPREDQRAKNKNSDPEIDVSKIDFTELFEKAEQGKTLSEWTKYDENKNDTIEKCPQLNLISKKSRRLDEILDNAISSRCSKLNLEPPPILEVPEPDAICEDEIDNILQPKLVVDSSVFKETTPILSSIKPISHLNSDLTPVPSLNLNDRRQNLLTSLSKPIVAHDEPLNISKLSHELLETRSINYHDVKSQVPFTPQVSDYKNNTKFLSEIEPQFDVTPIYRSKIKTSLTDLNSPPVQRLTCQKEAIPMLHTVKMDFKAKKVRRIVKTDAEKIGFTKGPDITEKSIVLPQIMKRLAERKQAMEEQQMQRKLMLETFEKFNQNLDFDDSNCVANTKKIIKPQIPLNMEAPIKNVTNLMHDGACGRKQENSAKLAAYQKPEVSLKPEMSLKPPAYYLEPEIPVALEPKVLMENCSLKRIKALKTRIAFEKFVNTGELPP